MNDVKVSVCVITYKHAEYIRKCLDSILAQKVNFKYEIVVGEDCSNDGTREILLEYKEKYPDIFVLLLNEENMGASKNGYNVKLHCQGMYHTSCEGDDFWIDEYKMQKQADFLDQHPEYVAVASDCVAVDINGNNPKRVMLPWQTNKRYTLKKFLRHGMVTHGSTMMFRNVMPYHDEKFKKLRFAEPTMGDVITRVLLYDKGDIFVLPDVTLAHRSGAANPTSFSFQQKGKSMYYTRMYFRIVDNVSAYLDGKYDLEPLKANRMSAMVRSYILGRLKNEKEEFKAVWKEMSFRLKWLSATRGIKRMFKVFFQGIARKIIRK